MGKARYRCHLSLEKAATCLCALIYIHYNVPVSFVIARISALSVSRSCVISYQTSRKNDNIDVPLKCCVLRMTDKLYAINTK